MAFVDQFLQDHDAYRQALDLAEGDRFLANLVRLSCFNTVLVQDVLRLCTTGDDRPAAVMARLQGFLRPLFCAWGSTKLIEDSFGTMRDREQRDVKNASLRASRLWM
eukprot:9783823-Lingulodinium_polyedra.AAC.1